VLKKLEIKDVNSNVQQMNITLEDIKGYKLYRLISDLNYKWMSHLCSCYNKTLINPGNNKVRYKVITL